MKVLIDTNILFSLFVLHDANHDKAAALFEKLVNQGVDMYITNLVIWETATVLSYKTNQQVAKDFLDRLAELKFGKIVFSEELEKDTWKVFMAQDKKGTSFIDCANLAVVKKYKFDGILSFDEFYSKSLRVN